MLVSINIKIKKPSISKKMGLHGYRWIGNYSYPIEREQT